MLVPSLSIGLNVAPSPLLCWSQLLRTRCVCVGCVESIEPDEDKGRSTLVMMVGTSSCISIFTEIYRYGECSRKRDGTMMIVAEEWQEFVNMLSRLCAISPRGTV